MSRGASSNPNVNVLPDSSADVKQQLRAILFRDIQFMAKLHGIRLKGGPLAHFIVGLFRVHVTCHSLAFDRIYLGRLVWNHLWMLNFRRNHKFVVLSSFVGLI
jgi:hypothetical protein